MQISDNQESLNNTSSKVKGLMMPLMHLSLGFEVTYRPYRLLRQYTENTMAGGFYYYFRHHHYAIMSQLEKIMERYTKLLN
jgi:hypothetical protein